MHTLSVLLLAGGCIGLLVALLQVVAVRRHGRASARGVRATSVDAPTPPISILKPLCGQDDDLASNLELFATGIDYPAYELVLGVRSTNDGAYPAALEAQARWPDRVSVQIQVGEPGLNPKVNQLMTLSRAARHELQVISDSNVQVGPGYLRELAALLSQSHVGLVTNPTVGVGEQTLGALLDNLHMTCSVGSGMVAAKHLANEDVVVGKSMAFWRADMEALGGFGCVKDILAEDWVIGRAIPRVLGKEVVVATEPVFNLTRRRTVSGFLDRFARWAVMQRQAVGTPVYLAQGMLQPMTLALAGLLCEPSRAGLITVAVVVVGKMSCDAVVALTWRPQGLPLLALAASPLRDLLMCWAWLTGLAKDTVSWRGSALRVKPGTKLVPIDQDDDESAPDITTAA